MREHVKGHCTDNHIDRGAYVQSTTYSTIGRYNFGDIQTCPTKTRQNAPITRSSRNAGNVVVPSGDPTSVSTYDNHSGSHPSLLGRLG